MVELPEPTAQEARALILGSGGFWACWGLAVPFFTSGVWISMIAFIIAFVCGAWLYFGGIFHVWARAQGKSVMGWYIGGLGKAPWKAAREGYGWGWMRLILPSSYRRAAPRVGMERARRTYDSRGASHRRSFRRGLLVLTLAELAGS
jgi:hypothetical protein